MASARQKKKNTKTTLLRLNTMRLEYLKKLSKEDSDLEREISALEKKLKQSRKKLEVLKAYSTELDHRTKAAAREVAQKQIDHKKAEFMETWIGKLTNEGKNQAMRVLHDKGIIKSKSDYYEDFLMDNQENLSQEEIDEAIERHLQEVEENILVFAEKAAKMENPFKNFKKRYR